MAGEFLRTSCDRSESRSRLHCLTVSPPSLSLPLLRLRHSSSSLPRGKSFSSPPPPFPLSLQRPPFPPPPPPHLLLPLSVAPAVDGYERRRRKLRFFFPHLERSQHPKLKKEGASRNKEETNTAGGGDDSRANRPSPPSRPTLYQPLACKLSQYRRRRRTTMR